MELNIKVAGQFNEVSLYDSGVELVCISKVAVKELNLPWNPNLKLNMQDANGRTKTNTGVVENLELTIVGIIEKAPYCLLLGQLFQMAAQCDMEDVGETLVIFDPKQEGHHVQVPMTLHRVGKHHQVHLLLTAPPSPVLGPMGAV